MNDTERMQWNDRSPDGRLEEARARRGRRCT